MKKIILSTAVALTAMVGLIQSASAGGYLTAFGTGIAVTDYMVNNNVGAGGSAIGITVMVSGISNPNSCGATTMVHIKSSSPGYKEMTAAVLSAIASGRRIGFYSSGCETLPFFGGGTTYPIVSDLWVVN